MQVATQSGRIDPEDETRAAPEKTAGTELVEPSSQPSGRGARGMTTAEYAVGTVATVSFAGVLISVLTNPAIRELLLQLIVFLIKLFWPNALG